MQNSIFRNLTIFYTSSLICNQCILKEEKSCQHFEQTSSLLSPRLSSTYYLQSTSTLFPETRKVWRQMMKKISYYDEDKKLMLIEEENDIVKIKIAQIT